MKTDYVNHTLYFIEMKFIINKRIKNVVNITLIVWELGGEKCLLTWYPAVSLSNEGENEKDKFTQKYSLSLNVVVNIFQLNPIGGLNE